jgi:hypothetical protein
MALELPNAIQTWLTKEKDLEDNKIIGSVKQYSTSKSSENMFTG